MRTALLLLMFALCLPGCPYRHHHGWRPTQPLPTSPEGLSLAFQQGTGTVLAPGHQVELVQNGAIFDLLEQEIQAAHSSLHTLSYIWLPSELSERLLRALAARRPGVACRVLVDPDYRRNGGPV